MNVAGINAQIIYDSNSKIKHVRRKFLKDLSLDLIRGQVNQRQNVNLPRELVANVRRHSIRPLPQEPFNKVQKKQGRCVKCLRKKDRKTKYT